jgi:hypothetical protein
VSPVEEVAGAGPERQQPHGGLGGHVERVEEQQRDRAGPVGRHGAQRGGCDDAERALRAAQQPGQVDEALPFQVVQAVAAVRGPRRRLKRADHVP